MGTQQVDPGMLELIERLGLRRREQFQGLAERTGLHAGHRRSEDAFGMPRRIGGQQHRPVQERRGRGQAAPGLRPARRLLKLDGDLLVRPGRGLGPVPGPAIRIDLRIGHLRQRSMDLLAVRERRRPVCRRAQQRMPEPDPAGELGQACLYSKRCILDGDA